MAYTYCDITDDLKAVYPRIDEFQNKELVENWTKTSGQTNVYEKRATGYVAMVFEDGVQLTIKTSVGDVDSNASSFYYDGDTDVLYIHTSGSDAPSGYEIEVGEDWDAFKTSMRNKAQEYLDGMLNPIYPTPLQPKSRSTHTSNTYEAWVTDAAAILTCWLLIKRVDLIEAEKVYKMFSNPNPEVGEGVGILEMVKDGSLVREDQISKREAGKWNIYPYASNTVNQWPILYGKYTGSMFKTWRIQIDTAGALGTATYKVSYDGGSTWDLTLQDTKDPDNDEYRFYIASGVYVEWPDETYVEGEYWDVELYPQTDTAEVVSNIGSARLYR